ncbi:hypothetical protein [Mesorhizobium sp. M1272]|uniref:hypothetical protein n=1 Tax=Mesorhizobium sp. M1272 TaxID=2957074 RepID=UPI00333B7F6C
MPQLTLLNVESIEPDWAGWDEVLRRSGIPYGPLRGHRCSKFFVALQALRLISALPVRCRRLARTWRKLIRIADLELDATEGYYLTWNDSRSLSRGAERVSQWLRNISAEERSA